MHYLTCSKEVWVRNPLDPEFFYGEKYYAHFTSATKIPAKEALKKCGRAVRFGNSFSDALFKSYDAIVISNLY